MRALAVDKAAAVADERKSEKRKKRKYRRKVLSEYQNRTFGSFCNL
jgi:hypothetical protein